MQDGEGTAAIADAAQKFYVVNAAGALKYPVIDTLENNLEIEK